MDCSIKLCSSHTTDIKYIDTFFIHRQTMNLGPYSKHLISFVTYE
jgi:hypothetical protein